MVLLFASEGASLCFFSRVSLGNKSNGISRCDDDSSSSPILRLLLDSSFSDLHGSINPSIASCTVLFFSNTSLYVN